ncbi:hypothetical protein [Antarcticimicrobium sediminis]|uniref:Uncharacterized protein n=1 Tax=Antarcticimicrobium sediminis TaxID=2546227 RepID=A0A4R5EK09_9RHOB|nr:hypothetical protein [Antarcticimicrobium sediminis]TDE34929.1 hypothetical protein E1B25_18555 [Antarcticimicrobium sediminis]
MSAKILEKGHQSIAQASHLPFRKQENDAGYQFSWRAAAFHLGSLRNLQLLFRRARRRNAQAIMTTGWKLLALGKRRPAPLEATINLGHRSSFVDVTTPCRRTIRPADTLTTADTPRDPLTGADDPLW